MILLDNRYDNLLNIELFEEIAKYLNVKKDIELLIVDNPTIKELNRDFRGVDKETDVLSFPLEDIKHTPLGSIIISKDKAVEVSKRLGHSVEDEMALLFIHALLHLLGYDHEVDSGEMREVENKVVEEFKLPKSLIVRSG